MLDKERSAVHTATGRVAPIWSKWKITLWQELWRFLGYRCTLASATCFSKLRDCWGIHHLEVLLCRITGPDHQSFPLLHSSLLSNGVAACTLKHTKKLLQWNVPWDPSGQSQERAGKWSVWSDHRPILLRDVCLFGPLFNKAKLCWIRIGFL